MQDSNNLEDTLLFKLSLTNVFKKDFNFSLFNFLNKLFL